MSIQVMSGVWGLDLPPNQQLVLLAYADHADHDGNHVRPSRELIAWKTGYSADSVQRITKNLRDAELIVVTKEATPGRPTEYRIDLAAGTRRERPTRKGGQYDHPSAVKGGHRRPPKGGQPCPPQPSIEPSYVPNAPAPAHAREATPAEQHILTILAAVAAAKRAKLKPQAALKACRQHHDRDHPTEADLFSHYWLDGLGENRAMRDTAAAWRNWLARAPTAATRRHPRPADAGLEARRQRGLQAIQRLTGDPA